MGISGDGDTSCASCLSVPVHVQVQVHVLSLPLLPSPFLACPVWLHSAQVAPRALLPEPGHPSLAADDNCDPMPPHLTSAKHQQQQVQQQQQRPRPFVSSRPGRPDVSYTQNHTTHHNLPLATLSTTNYSITINPCSNLDLGPHRQDRPALPPVFRLPSRPILDHVLRAPDSIASSTKSSPSQTQHVAARFRHIPPAGLLAEQPC